MRHLMIALAAAAPLLCLPAPLLAQRSEKPAGLSAARTAELLRCNALLREFQRHTGTDFSDIIADVRYVLSLDLDQRELASRERDAEVAMQREWRDETSAYDGADGVWPQVRIEECFAPAEPLPPSRGPTSISCIYDRWEPDVDDSLALASMVCDLKHKWDDERAALATRYASTHADWDRSYAVLSAGARPAVAAVWREMPATEKSGAAAVAGDAAAFEARVRGRFAGTGLAANELPGAIHHLRNEATLYGWMSVWSQRGYN